MSWSLLSEKFAIYLQSFNQFILSGVLGMTKEDIALISYDYQVVIGLFTSVLFFLLLYLIVKVVINLCIN